MQTNPGSYDNENATKANLFVLFWNIGVIYFN